MTLQRELRGLDDALMGEAVASVLANGIANPAALETAERTLQQEYPVLTKVASAILDTLKMVGYQPGDAEAAAGGAHIGFCILKEYGDKESVAAQDDSDSIELRDSLRSITHDEAAEAVSSVFATIIAGNEEDAEDMSNVLESDYPGLMLITGMMISVLEHCSGDEKMLVNPDLNIQSVALGAMAMATILKDISEKRLFQPGDL